MGKRVAYTGPSTKAQSGPAPFENQPASKTLGYVRVSTQQQDAQDTQEAQKSAITAFCLSRGLTVDEWLEEQESTLNPDRREFQTILHKLESGEVTSVVVAALDRFSRDQIETLQAIELIKKTGASFYCIRDNINITNGQADLSTEMVISVMSLFAKNERETIRTRTMAGKERKQKIGQWVTGMPPLGYGLDRQTKVLTVNAAEANIVRTIFNLRLHGIGTLRIVKKLNATVDGRYEKRYQFKSTRYCKVNQKQRKTSYCKVRRFHEEYQVCHACIKQYAGVDITGTSWSPTLIKKVLKNRVYLGEIKHRQEWSQAKHDAIIDQHVFDRVQEILKKEYQHPYQSYPRNILTGLVHCSCGSRMYLTSGGRQAKIDAQGKKHVRKEYWAYVCPKRKVGQCDQKSIQVAEIKNKVSVLMTSLLTDKHTIDIMNLAYQRLLSNRAEFKPDIDVIRKDLDHRTEQYRRLRNAYINAASSGLPEEDLSLLIEQMHVIKEQKDSLASKVTFIEAQDSALTQTLNAVSIIELVADIFMVWNEILHSTEEKHLELAGQIVRAFISRIAISGKEIKPEVRFDDQLLKRPLDELLHAVLRLQQLVADNPDLDKKFVRPGFTTTGNIMVIEKDTSC